MKISSILRLGRGKSRLIVRVTTLLPQGVIMGSYMPVRFLVYPLSFVMFLKRVYLDIAFSLTMSQFPLVL
jgi:hypothetical protein